MNQIAHNFKIIASSSRNDAYFLNYIKKYYWGNYQKTGIKKKIFILYFATENIYEREWFSYISFWFHICSSIHLWKTVLFLPAWEMQVSTNTVPEVKVRLLKSRFTQYPTELGLRQLPLWIIVCAIEKTAKICLYVTCCHR